MDFRKRFPALFYHDFLLLWIGQGISLIGSQMQMVALNYQMYEITHSAIALGLIGMARFVPIVIFSLLGGSFSDVHNRKTILLWTQSLTSIFAVILGILTLTYHITPFFMFALTFLASAAMSFDTPARQALIPNLVEKEDISNAMSINVIMWDITAVTGPALGGLAIASIGVGNIYILNALSYLAVIVALLQIRNSGEVLEKTSSVSFQAILEGITFVRSRTIIWSTMLLDFFSTFFASATSLLPLFAKDILHVGPQGLGILYAAGSVGSIIAGVSLAHRGNIKKQGKVLLIGITFYALGTIVFGLSKSYLLSFIALAILGAGDAVSTILRNTIRQLTTPDSIRGRMTSINMIFFMGGPLSVIVGGVGTLAVIAITAYTIPTLRNYHSE